MVKYWGKYGEQLPKNASISFTLSNCHTRTSVLFQKKSTEGFDFEVYLDGKQEKGFEPKIQKFFERVEAYVPFLKNYQFKIEIGNLFSSEFLMIKFFGKFYMITGIISIIIQLFLSGRILSYFGVSAGIGSYPFLTIAGSVTFIFFSPFFALSLIKGVDQIIKPTMLGTSMELIWLPISPKKKKITKPFSIGEIIYKGRNIFKY